MGVRVLVVDDHALLRSGVRALLVADERVEDVIEARDGASALVALQQRDPDAIVVDLTMQGGGVDLVARIRREAPDIRLVVLTMHDDDTLRDLCLRAGASRYVCKRDTDTLVAALLDELPGPTPRPERRADLSRRERQVLELVALGHTQAEVADFLGVSVKTVETYRSRLAKKLDLHSRSDLVAFAVRAGFVTAERLDPD